MINKKRASMAIEQPIIFVIVILVIFLVLNLIFGFDFLGWIKNLPIFSQFQYKYEKSCDDYWNDISKKNFTLIFKGECNNKAGNKIDFGSFGECCVEVNNEYLAMDLKDENVKWYWKGQGCSMFKEYHPILFYDTKSKIATWRIRLEQAGTLFDGGTSCSPVGFYNCEGTGIIDVREGKQCQEIKEKAGKIKEIIRGEFDKITVLIRDKKISYLLRGGKELIKPICSDENPETNDLKLIFTEWDDGYISFVWNEQEKLAYAKGIAKDEWGERSVKYHSNIFERILGGNMNQEIFKNIGKSWENEAILRILKSQSLGTFLSQINIETRSNKEIVYSGENLVNDVYQNRLYYKESWLDPGYCLDLYNDKKYCEFPGGSGICYIKDDGRICLVGKEERCGETCLCEENYEDGDIIKTFGYDTTGYVMKEYKINKDESGYLSIQQTK